MHPKPVSVLATSLVNGLGTGMIVLARLLPRNNLDPITKAESPAVTDLGGLPDRARSDFGSYQCLE